jgi:antitoxin component YwqK of YwqJK toxin-antitoxin module
MTWWTTTVAVIGLMLTATAAQGQSDCLERAEDPARTKPLAWRGGCCDRHDSPPSEIHCELDGRVEAADEHGIPTVADADGKPVTRDGHEICTEHGKPILDVTWVQGKREGRGWYIEGAHSDRYRLVFLFKNDKADGAVRLYDDKAWSKDYIPESGPLICEATYQDGEPSGIAKDYYPSGKLRAAYLFRQGKTVPERIVLNQQGAIEELACGTQSLVPEDYGACGFSGTAVETRLFPGGSFQQTVVYRSGMLLEERFERWDTFPGKDTADQVKGMRIYTNPPDRTTYSAKDFYANGKVFRSQSVKNGKADGPLLRGRVAQESRQAPVSRSIDALRDSSGLTQPILLGEALDSGELPLVVGDERIAECDDLSGDEQIVAADRRSCLFEASAERAIDGVGWRLERQNVKRAEHRLKLSGQPWRTLFRSAVS